MHNRRQFLKKAATIAIVTNITPVVDHKQDNLQGQIVTVTGTISPDQMGTALIHEHVMSTFGKEPMFTPEYDTQQLFAQVLPYLKKVRSLGCKTIVECTAAYFGRAPELLKQLSLQSGLQILTNTGYYGAANDRYVPEHAYTEDAETVAQHWIKEWKNGIGKTGIKPGFIKTGVDNGPLSAIDAKLVRATAKTHLHTGLTTACHTGNNQEAVQATLDILSEEGVSPKAWIWTHAHQVEHLDVLLPAIKQGVWISLDGVQIQQKDNGQTTTDEGNMIEKHVSYLTALKKKGYWNQVLISHDGNSFTSSDTDNIRPYDAIFTHLVPRLEKEGFTQKELDQLLVKNPQEAFKINIKMQT